MEDWVRRALERWPDVPALFGWLGLDRKGRWTIKGETISRPQIIDTINANYAADDQGRWYFQNGPQRGYVRLEVAPLILYSSGDEAKLITHTQLPVTDLSAAWLTEDGSLILNTEHGPGLLADADLGWALARLSHAAQPIDDADLTAALALPSGTTTSLALNLDDRRVQLTRLDLVLAPATLAYVLDPQPTQ
jgi:hypothetical protein